MSALLRITAPSGLVKIVDFKQDLTLGRSLEAEISFPEEAGLSRSHVAFERGDGDTAVVRDLSSLNGTWVNGERISGRRELRNGDSVKVAGLTIAYEQVEKSAAPTVTFDAPAESTFSGSEQVTNLQTILHRSATTTSSAGALDSRRIVAEALLRVGRELARNQPLSELFQTILQVAIHALGAERGVVVTLQDGEPVVQAHEGGALRISQRVRDRVLQEKVSLIIRDVEVDPNWESHDSLVAQGIRSVMAAPLQTDEEVIGMLYLDSSGASGRKFDVQDLELMTVMANVAAIRIERERFVEAQRASELLAAELRRAEEIQRQCLPEHPPQLDGMDLAASTQPCYTVGGDYYDFVPTKDGRLAVVLADVAGKGLSAALLMMNLQARVQVLAAELTDPAAVVQRLNEMLLPVCPASRFVTLVFGFLNPSTGEFHYTNAGHEPPLLLRPGGGLELLEAGGPVVGMLPGLQYETGLCVLGPSDALILFSDGLSEARGPGGEEFGPERIAEAFRASGEVAASTKLRALGGRVGEWLGGSSFHDDMTVVTVIRK